MASDFTDYLFLNIISSSLEAHRGLRILFLLRRSSFWGAEQDMASPDLPRIITEKLFGYNQGQVAVSHPICFEPGHTEEETQACPHGKTPLAEESEDSGISNLHSVCLRSEMQKDHTRCQGLRKGQRVTSHKDTVFKTWRFTRLHSSCCKTTPAIRNSGSGVEAGTAQ